jgi:hypothetical protein
VLTTQQSVIYFLVNEKESASTKKIGGCDLAHASWGHCAHQLGHVTSSNRGSQKPAPTSLRRILMAPKSPCRVNTWTCRWYWNQVPRQLGSKVSWAEVRRWTGAAVHKAALTASRHLLPCCIKVGSIDRPSFSFLASWGTYGAHDVYIKSDLSILYSTI